MADSIGSVTVDVEAWAEAFRDDRGGLIWLPPDEPRTDRLDDDSIDRLATAIADKLTERQQADPMSRLRRYWANGRSTR